ncbi:TSV2 [Auxenochlorella protothecoides x Auxenochlorella symbiontica]
MTEAEAVQAATSAGPVDPEKAAKKAAKAAEKQAKKQKALDRAAAEAAKAAEGAPAGSSRRAKAKEEAEAKKAVEAAELAAWLEQARTTPKGSKKELPGKMPKGYDPKAVETAWYDWWEASRYFAASSDSCKPPFAMVIPPPNVTGSLHIGHALTLAIQDTLCRWRRMSGYEVCWVPGTDHAGIATQTVVERQLARETGQTRHDLGRAAFLDRVHDWVARHGDRILYQCRRLGASLDWDRRVFTMDAKLSAAVQEAFLRLHAQGLIYRDHRLVNWDCRLKTAVSDIEVDYVDVPGPTMLAVPGYTERVEFGVLTSFAYPLEGGEGEVVVATTRPETMFGDTAIAVHPDDPRYQALVGRHVVHPVNGRRLPIVADAELVDMAFGTGAVKITPAHDPNDFATGKRHGLEFVNVLDDDGRMNGDGTGEFAGMPRFAARVAIVDWLKARGLFRGAAPNPMRLGVCSRSSDVIEPVLKPQWWVACAGMAAAACEAVRTKAVRIVPAEFEATWFRWLENVRDWCISRQLWWGHRIPAYYVAWEGDEAGAPGAPSEDTSRWVVAASEAEALELAAARFPGRALRLTQDEDVLDTWFSSGLFPMSVFGWPGDSPDLRRFYPGALLETGHDILFFWVARMVMLGQQLMGEVPFKDVYLHSIVRDAQGRKMSKTLGNVIDPVNVIEGISLQDLHASLEGGNLEAAEVARAREGQVQNFPDGIEECGTDALRFALVAYSSQGRDVNLDIKRVVAYRHWCNKLWNAIRFAMLNLGEDYAPPEGPISHASLPFACRWVLSRLDAATAEVDRALSAYEFAAATTAVYAFWQYDLCDVFIELSKPVLAKGGAEAAEGSAELAATRTTLWTCLETGLRLLHPFMPYVTEELWQRLPRGGAPLPTPSVMLAEYPRASPDARDARAEADMAYLLAVVNRCRSLRADYGLTRERPALHVACADGARRALLAASAVELATLTDSASAALLSAGEAPPAGCGVAVVDDATTLYLSLAGILDAGKEVEKLAKKEAEAAARIEALEKKMALLSYKERTPAEVKEADGERLAKAQAELESLRAAKADMQALA